jgi:hypothetical protein
MTTTQPAAGRIQSFRQRHPRHPAEVTADRLADAVDKWPDRFDGGDRDAVAQIRHILNDIAENAGRTDW